jgi:histidinol-phosphate aminotransferase
MFDLQKITRPNVRALQQYSSARDEFQGTAAVMLDANENPYGNGLNRYPDPYQRELKTAISTLKKVPESQLFLGNGSDEIIDLLMRAFCNPGTDQILINPPTYGMYEVCAGINDVAVNAVPLTADYQLDTPAILAGINGNTKLIFVCSPNNPTGNDLRLEAIVELLESFHGIVVVDEAYCDFSNSVSYVSLLEAYPNLVVLQTLSKAWGMAAIRLGMGFASPQIVAVLNKIKPPYNVSLFTQQLAVKTIDNLAAKDEFVKQILAEKRRLELALNEIDLVLDIKPSDANFLLVKVTEADVIYNYLVSKNIVVRNRTNALGCENCLRISVGTTEQTEVLLAALRTFETLNETIVLN